MFSMLSNGKVLLTISLLDIQYLFLGDFTYPETVLSRSLEAPEGIKEITGNQKSVAIKILWPVYFYVMVIEKKSTKNVT